MRHSRRLTATLSSLALAALIGVMLLAGAPTAIAARSAAAGPDDAMAPDNDWHPINPGEQHWYAFHYAGSGSPLEIRLQVTPQGGGEFELWTPHDLKRWADGAEVVPVGRGSPDPAADDTLVWSGSFNIPGTYYAIVEHAGSQPGTSYYTLNVTGDGVSLAPPSQPTPEPVSQSKPAKPTTPSGKLVFQTILGGPFYSINADGSNLQAITDGVDPIWSPDGNQIAFTRWREPRGLWVVSANGSNEWRAFDANRARWPSWAPDGQELLFSQLTGAGRQQETEFCFRGFCFTFPAHPHWRLGILRPSDNSFRELSSSEIAHAPMWSPDGSAIVYDDIQGLRAQSLDRSVDYMITTDPRDTGPAWSPDGRRVGFTRWQHDHWEVYVVDDSGQNLMRLTTTPTKPDGNVGNSAAPAWSPDGQYIAFLTDRSGQWQIWIMRADGSGQKPMFKDQLDGLPIEYTFQSERAISWTK